MVLFLECCVAAMGLFVVLISIRYRKIPGGLIERLLIIATVIILVVWILKGV